MIIYPAMDLMNQTVVRLKKGDFASKKIYEDNPLRQAKQFALQGATHLHVIDLDGAKTGIPHHVKLLKSIKQETGLKIQYGGGLRKEQTILQLLDDGIDKIILGSFALMHPKPLSRLVNQFPSRIVVAVDIQDGIVTYAGWQHQSLYTLNDYLAHLVTLGVEEVLLTDIAKDGMLQGMDVAMYAQLKQTYPSLKIIASGGLTTVNEASALKLAQIDGLIAGVALYEKKITLKDLLSC